MYRDNGVRHQLISRVVFKLVGPIRCSVQSFFVTGISILLARISSLDLREELDEDFCYCQGNGCASINK